MSASGLLSYGCQEAEREGRRGWRETGAWQGWADPVLLQSVCVSVCMRERKREVDLCVQFMWSLYTAVECSVIKVPLIKGCGNHGRLGMSLQQTNLTSPDSKADKIPRSCELRSGLSTSPN